MSVPKKSSRVMICTELRVLIKMKKRARKLGVPLEQYMSKLLCDDSFGCDLCGKKRRV